MTIKKWSFTWIMNLVKSMLLFLIYIIYIYVYIGYLLKKLHFWKLFATYGFINPLFYFLHSNIYLLIDYIHSHIHKYIDVYIYIHIYLYILYDIYYIYTYIFIFNCIYTYIKVSYIKGVEDDKFNFPENLLIKII